MTYDHTTTQVHSQKTKRLLYDPGTGFAFKGATNIFRIGNQCLLSAVLKEPDDGLDLRCHRTFGKVRAFGKILFRLSKGHLIEPLLFGLAKMDSHFFDSRGN